MAYIQERPHKGGESTFQVRWKEGGGRNGEGQTEKFSDLPSAAQFKALVDAHGQHWPPGWVRGEGFVQQPAVPGDRPFEVWATRYVDRLTGVDERTREDYWRRRTRELLDSFVRSAWRRGGASITGSFDLDEPGVADELAARLEELSGRITTTTEQVLRSQLLAHGIAEGESVPELRARIQRVFTDLSDYRGTMIARTESVGGYSAASHRAAVDAGATHKTWLSTDDTRTRATHRAAKNSKVAVSKRFPLTESRWPADPAAPAAQSIQCRCALTYEFEES